MTFWCGAVTFTLISLLAVQTWYFTEMLWAKNRRYQQQIRELNAEYRTQNEMLKRLRLPDVIQETDDA